MYSGFWVGQVDIPILHELDRLSQSGHPDVQAAMRLIEEIYLSLTWHEEDDEDEAEPSKPGPDKIQRAIERAGKCTHCGKADEKPEQLGIIGGCVALSCPACGFVRLFDSKHVFGTSSENEKPIEPPKAESDPPIETKPQPPKPVEPPKVPDGPAKRGPKPYGATSDERRIVDRIMAAHKEHKNFSEIARMLNDEGFKTRTGKEWQPQTVKNVIDG